MPFHIIRRTEFLNRPPTHDPATILGTAARYAVQLEQTAAATGGHCWRVVGVHHLTPEENQGNHVVYVDLLDERGNRVDAKNLSLEWGWEGQRPDEKVEPRRFDKPADEPATNVELYSGQLLWVRVAGDGLASDTVTNLHTKHADEPGPQGQKWNSIGHHSFYILFQRTQQGEINAVNETPDSITPDSINNDSNAKKSDEVSPLDGVNPLGDPAPASTFRFSVWPTEQRLITQPFGVNPDNYREYGLAGHEGVDIAAPIGSRIVAVAPGTVKLVQPTDAGHPYGIHVRLSHSDGYETIYAHLQSAAVIPGQRVDAGQLLGLADSTGNARGDHLHLTLKRQGADTPGYPNQIIDPMPFLQPLLQTAEDGAVYVHDLIIDGTQVDANQPITQAWTIRNTGSSAWDAGYLLVFESGVRLGDSDTIPVPPTAPGAEATIPLTFDAPTTPGNYRSNWRLRNSAGQPFGQRLWVDITVKEAVAPVNVVRGNKLGFYLHLSTDQFGMWDAVRRVQPPVILIHADSANDMLLNEIRAFRAPNAFVIGRWYITNDEQRALLESADPAGAGRNFAERIVTYDFGKFTKRAADGRLLIDAWMSLNECLPGPASSSYREDPARYQRLYGAYDQFQVAFHNRLQEAGIEAIAFNFAAGNFTEPAHYLDHFPQTLATYTHLGFHEYGWPSLLPGPGVATGAILYRRVLEGIRAQHGDRHRVVMTEAGVTRAYGHPYADEGWLNNEQPLDESQYWASLAWYNHQLGQDSYVTGACLYEVGHDGKWASFRHLGTDNSGQPLHLVEKLVALRESAGARGVAMHGGGHTETAYSLRGNVRFTDKGIEGALVRIVGDRATLGRTRGAVIAAPGTVNWSRPIHGFAGSLRNAWDRFVAGEVAGLTWAEFKRDAVKVNPMLAANGGTFDAEATYYLPETTSVPPTYLWQRVLQNYQGTIHAVWLDLVQGKVPGLPYSDFRSQMIAYNPTLANGGRLVETERYLLPHTLDAEQFYLAATTTATGRFRFTDLPAGSYTVQVDAPGMNVFSATIDLNEQLPDGDLEVEIELFPLLDLQVAPQTRGSTANQFMGVIGNEFVVDQRIVRFIGVNLRGLVYYGSGLTNMLQYTTEGHRHETVQQAAAMGAKVVRVFLPCINASAEQTIALLQKTLDVLGNHNLYLIPAFVDFYKSTDFRIAGDDDFYAQLDPNFHHELLKGNFYRGGYRQRYLPFVNAIVKAFQDDPRIFAWEIGNELKYEPAHDDPDRAAFIEFMLTTARAIKRIDANHLVTTGMISTSHASLDVDNLWRKLYSGPEFDFLTVHCYNKEYKGKQDHDYAQTLNKPFIVEEAGFGRDCPGDRVELTRRDMDHWFGLGARGYMQWGYMPVAGDIGDGDDDAGMDRKWHGHDFEGLFQLYHERASVIQAEADRLPQPKKSTVTKLTMPEKAMERPALTAGETVYAQDWVNVRQSAGYVGKAGDDVVGILGPGAMVKLMGTAVTKDRLHWWPIEGTKSDGDTVIGWMAEATGAALLLSDMAPALPRGASYNVLVGLRTDYAQSFLNLRQSPGYVDKAADDVIGQVPIGSPVTVLDGAEEADELRWWEVRAPLLDDQVGRGWVAETAPNGFPMLAATPPEETINDGSAVHKETNGTTTGTTNATTEVESSKTVTVVGLGANLRTSAAYLNQPPSHIVAQLPQGTVLNRLSEPVMADGLDWVQVVTPTGVTPALRGWVALADPSGVRLLLPTAVAATIQISRPCGAQWPLTQGWGSWPEFYAQFLYDGVPLKGHNGLDFGTPENTSITACDAGSVLRIGFEAGGFGNFVIMRHAWGESLYAHLNRIDLLEGSPVKAGEQIALSGNTGAGTGAHLHFGIRITPYRRTDGWGGFCDPTPFMAAGTFGGSRSLQRPSAMAPELPGRLRP